MVDWDDLRIFIAAAQLGSLNNAAQRLAMDATTVGRRVARLETALKATLFTRTTQGLQLTTAGARLLEHAREAEAAIEATLRAGHEDSAAGVVRISLSEGFGTHVVAPSLPALRTRRPGLAIELVANPGFLSPSKREVDMAVTLSAPDTARLVVEPLTEYRLGLYAAPDYLARAGTPTGPDDLGRFEIIGYVEDLIYARELNYLDAIQPGLRPVLASSSIRAQRELIAAGGGIGVLPCFMAGDLAPVLRAQVSLTRRFWMATHRDVARTARVRLIREWLKELVIRQRPLLLPDQPAASTRP